MRETGKYIETSAAGEKVQAFVPYPLPPHPALDQTPVIQNLLQMALTKLSELRIASTLVPNPDLFNYAYVRKEAILSSQIEGVQATLTDLLNYEADKEQNNNDIQEVCNYLDALHFGRKQLADSGGLPLSLRLIKDIHKKLMKGVRGATKQPGEFRSSQNWIGGTRPGTAHFVPPPKLEMQQCLHEFEKYLHQKEDVPLLIKIGMAHVQFETIHPFLDGNGRLGRLLIALLLEHWGFLDARLLYLSLFLKKHQNEYYSRLDSVRSKGDWEGWIQFFLEGVTQVAEEAIRSSQEIFRIFERDRKRLLGTKNVIVPAIRLFEELPNHPVVTVNSVVKILDTTKPTAASAIGYLEKAGILYKTTNVKRFRVFGYKNYIDILKA